MKAAGEGLTDATRAIAALRGAGLELDSLELLDRRMLLDGGVAAYRLRGLGITGAHAETFGYARWGSPDHIAATLRRWRDAPAEPGPFGAGVRGIPGLPAALFLMPNDDGLPWLPSVTDPARLEHVLTRLPEFETAGWRVREHASRIDIVRYRPEVELDARVSLGLTHETSGASRALELNLRLFADRRSERLLADTHAWRAGGAAGVLPRPLGVLEDGHLYVEEASAGGPLSAAVSSGGVAPEAVAAALATLHGAHTTFADQRPADGRLLVVHEIFRRLRADDALDDRDIAAVAGPLTAALPAVRALRPVHGDLRLQKIRTRDAGLVFIELEDCAMGDPFDDWGSLIAHLVWESRTKFPEGAASGALAARLLPLARASAPERPARDLAFFIACAMLEIVGSPEREHVLEFAAVRLALQLAREALEQA